MATLEKLFYSIMSGTQDRNIKFSDLQKILEVLGFQCRIKGDHFIYWRDGGIKYMHKYERIIYWSEQDQKFIVEVPELSGCMADGSTAIEALENVETVISEWIETAKEIGREIPTPKGKLMYA